MNDDWFDLIVELQKADAQFMIVGAHAMAMHGVSRSTQDLDVWVRAPRSNGEKVWRAVVNFVAPVDALRLSPSDFTENDNVVQLGLPPNRIDLLTSLSGLTDFDSAWTNHVERRVRNRMVAFLGREELILNKRATGRLKDLADLEALGAIAPDKPNT